MSGKDAKKKAEAAKAPAAFPGGKAVAAPGELRIAVDRIPYSQIIGHAILEPDVEVGGVLVGAVGEDEHGTFVHVRHAIRAEGAHQENAAVTFTHETWNHIHQEMDAKYPDEQIVGWYHTHGGFGVFLSEMDTFIHQNFFPEPHHLAYVYDPLAGSEGFFVRKGDKLEPVERYWLGNRERRPAMRMPDPEPKRPAGDAVVEEIRKLTATVQWSAGEQRAAESSWTQYLPWAVALACVALLFLGPRGQPAEPRTRPGALVVDFEPRTLKAVTVPLRSAEDLGADTWILPVDLELPTVDGKGTARLPGLVALNDIYLARRAQLEHDATQTAEAQGFLTRWGLAIGGALAGLVALAAGAWYLFLRRT
jgi:proteasome lid subunit RPN8/RPN11